MGGGRFSVRVMGKVIRNLAFLNDSALVRLNDASFTLDADHLATEKMEHTGEWECSHSLKAASKAMCKSADASCVNQVEELRN